jgi:predicted RNA-binding Zn ribbon-like protein
LVGESARRCAGVAVAVHYVIVEGLRLPAKLGGHPALDFCNTLAGWNGHERWDYLRSYQHLATWAGFVGLLASDRTVTLRRDAAERPGAADTTLEQARELRARIYDLLAGGLDPHAFERVAEDVHAAAGRLWLRRTEQRIEWAIEPGAGFAAPTAAVAWSAGQLLTSPDLARVRVCPGDGCGWLFLDRRGRRRWCTMATCGNRAKARRFAERERSAARADPDAGQSARRTYNSRTG